jgi:hypothetical protein
LDVVDVRGLLSLLLTDGSLVSYRTPGGGYIQLTLTAGINQSAFLDDKVREFKEFLPSKAKITPYKSSPRANGRQTSVLRFRVSTNKLRPVYNLLYPGGERLINQIALDLLGASAAAWCWAQGAHIRPDMSAELSRVGKTYMEGARMQAWISMLTGAQPVLGEHRQHPRLYFTPSETLKVQTALIQYAPPSRIHLFKGVTPDVCSIRSSRTELLFGGGDNSSKGEKTAARAGDRP